MPRYAIPLQANKEVRLPYPGRVLQLVDTGAAASVHLKVEWGGDPQRVEDFGQCEDFFRLKADSGRFHAVLLLSTLNATVDLLVSDQDVTVTPISGTQVDADITAPLSGGRVAVDAVLDASQLPLPVQYGQGDAPGNPLYVSGTVLEDTPATSMADNPAIAVGDTATPLLAADPTRLEFRVNNNGTDAMAIGAPGITWADRVIVLQPGDTWVERRGAALAWEGITDTGNSASAAIQELFA